MSALTTSLRSLACVLVSAAAVQAQDYEIKFERDAIQGRRYHLVESVSETQQRSMTMGQMKRAMESKKAYAFKGFAQALQRNEEGRALEIRVEVESFTYSEEGGPAATAGEIAAGTTVTGVWKEGAAHWATAEGPLTAEQSKWLGKVFKLGPKEKQSHDDDDVVMGTSERQRVGDSWPINGEEAKQGLASAGMRTADAQCSGTAKLAEVVAGPGGEELKIEIDLEITGWNLPDDPRMSLELGESKVAISGHMLLPVDLSAPKSAEEQVIEMSYRGATPENPQGGRMAMDMTSRRVQSRSVRIAEKSGE